MTRAIVVGKWNAHKEDGETRRQGERPGNILEIQRDRLKLEKPSNYWREPKYPCGIDEYKKFQAVLAPNYLIKVHSQHPKDGLIFRPQFQMTRDTKVIHIYYNGENHYDTITSVPGFRGCHYNI